MYEPRALYAGCFVLVVALAAFLYFENLSYFNPCAFGPLFGMASMVILLSMFGLYLYAGIFYQDNFYNFLSVGWLLNAIYIFFESFFKPDRPDDLAYNLQIYALGIVTSLPFQFARFTTSGGSFNYRQLISSTTRWVIWLISSYMEVIYWCPINSILLTVCIGTHIPT